MTEIDKGEQSNLELATTSLRRSSEFWSSREPMYANQLDILARNYDTLLEAAEGSYALVIGDLLLPMNFADLDEAFDFAEANANGQLSLIHRVKKEGILPTEVYERTSSLDKIDYKESIYRTRGLVRGLVEQVWETMGSSEERKRKYPSRGNY